MVDSRSLATCRARTRRATPSSSVATCAWRGCPPPTGAVHRTFGEPPHRYLLTRRLERAAALLRTTDRPVTEICFAVGLRSLGSFTTSFRRIYGTSPRAYRAAHPPARSMVLIPGCLARAYGRPTNRTFREVAPTAGP
jgi:hypothetical protein